MGGQQFGGDTLHIDTRALNAAISHDANHGTIDVEAGIDWPRLIAATHRLQPGNVRWGIRQKQTGADNMTLGGSISANVHGRGLLMQPIVQDIEHLDVLLMNGEIVRCSRDANFELFTLVVGGYGLFGIIVRVRLRLAPRVKLRRLVDVIDIDDATNAIYRRVKAGCTYGDFQYSIDAHDSSFLRRGVFPCYVPVDESTPVDEGHADLTSDDWLKLIALAYRDKREAFARYSQYYLSTHGRVYWSDSMQLSTYLPDYAQAIYDAVDAVDAVRPDESLMIGELYVPPARLLAFVDAARRVLQAGGVEDIYGTIRAIRHDDVTFLPWARADYACMIFNLRTPHTPEGVARTSETFRRLNDAAIAESGSYFLTYHRYATRRQIEACYPMFDRFLHLKSVYDPAERLQSDWYRHHRSLFA